MVVVLSQPMISRDTGLVTCGIVADGMLASARRASGRRECVDRNFSGFSAS